MKRFERVDSKEKTVLKTGKKGFKEMVSNLKAMDSILIAMASNLISMDSNLEAMAPT